MEEKVKEIELDVKEITKHVFKLIEAQSTTTRNVDIISQDLREILKVTNSYDVFINRIDAIEKRMDYFDSHRTWFTRIVGGILIGAAMTALLGKGGL